ncbi:hypothetical protein BD311DRAFT_760199 [Dichomitus squalens]|uniref:Uncharacterized protein n=1 Tax=Dichomitus squalens TaxID=114155 RepID=A0A4Q9MMV8_9APHY|nr:hypothetical protein BD311DRAFT_760199 [Dichomitus squalens]
MTNVTKFCVNLDRVGDTFCSPKRQLLIHPDLAAATSRSASPTGASPGRGRLHSAQGGEHGRYFDVLPKHTRSNVCTGGGQPRSRPRRASATCADGSTYIVGQCRTSFQGFILIADAIVRSFSLAGPFSVSTEVSAMSVVTLAKCSCHVLHGV